MPELIARGADGVERWRRPLTEQPVVLGRRPDRCDWPAPWDPEISGRHARLAWRDGRLDVTRDATAKNPIFYRGNAVDACAVAPGEHFVLGRSSFAVAAADIDASAEALLARFLPRPVLAALAGRDLDEVLRPRPVDATVLLCDLRGWCGVAEAGGGDLDALWRRAGEALTVMTGAVAAEDGVVGDTQGDAALGFWGWPLPCPDGATRAARAALAIRGRLRALDLRCGVGVASGPAIAGLLGTADRGKVDVFGPTVNRAARLESMTKQFGVSVLMDEESVRMLQEGHAAWAGLRQVARVVPHGLTTPLTVTELRPADEGYERPNVYAAGLRAFAEGQWDAAARLFAVLPDDGPATALRRFMEERGGVPPTNWDGALPLAAK